MNIFLQEHQEILNHLLDCDVDFLLIGGYAVIYHGYKRTTGDMDLWLRPTNANRDKVIQALQGAGFEANEMEDLAGMDFSKHLAFSIGEEPQKIDFINYINQVTFEEANKNRLVFDFEGLKIPVININELILSKLNTGRKKDEADVEELQRIKNYPRH
jgi:predicted nucleotidyltransferase